MILGIDIGSSAAKAVLFDDALRLVDSREALNRGNPIEALREVLSRILSGRGRLLLHIGVTGVGREMVKTPPEIFFANEVVALALGAARGYPGVRSIIEIGAQTSRWVLLDPSAGKSAEPEILDFALNEVCAAGSGAFLEQQAARLQLTIEEFARIAASAPRGATVAGRCSVFAKTDMIHLQQKGTPLGEIALGLCQALARNFIATVLKGRAALAPVLLAGGGARNGGLVRAFRGILGLGDGSFIVADPPHALSAFGAAFGAALGGAGLDIPDAEFLFRLLEARPGRPKPGLRELGDVEIRPAAEPEPGPGEFVSGFLGVDIGSVSTNLVLVDADGRVRAGIYLPTKGRPIEVLKDGFLLLKKKCPAGFELLGIGTTGSGRHLAGTLLRADVVHNEITCQLRSAVHYFADVDTIFEIGGQDSKYVSARGGRILDFTMNKICAAGTGSFLEEQAEILGLRIEDEFSRLAASSAAPSDLGSRCTVFMESELADALGRGVPVADIAAGLAFSIARNYLEKVVAGRPVGTTVVFQGGVASNPSVVRALALAIGREIRVHPFNRISGAIGAALMAQERVKKTGKKSPDASAVDDALARPYEVAGFTCAHCANRCQVNRISFGSEVAFFGDACERYTSGQGLSAAGRSEEGAADARGPLPDLFTERTALLDGFIRNPERPALRVGIPRASILFESLPFWSVFFNRLGVEVVVSPASDSEILAAALRRLPAETCLPIKIAFGHIGWLEEKGLDRIFFPAIVDLHRNPGVSASFCPYSESFPFMARAATEKEILAPTTSFNGRPEDFVKSMAELRSILGRTEGEIRAAYESAVMAQREFLDEIRRRGREAIERGRRDGRSVWAVIGRPYALHDSFLNLNLGRHLAKLGVTAVPLDGLPLDGQAGVDWPGAPHWRYNRQAIQAALWVAEQQGMPLVVLTNFGCGLDAFNLRHIERIVSGKPHLILEFDEHRAEAGLITRLEAFQDEVRDGRPAGRSTVPVRRSSARRAEINDALRSRRFVLPYFGDHVYAFSGALRGVGIAAEVLPLPDEATVTLGEEYSTGKECHAYSILTGDFVKLARSPRPGNEVFYFPGSQYTCVLAQYDKALNYLAEDLGITDLEAFAPSGDDLPKLLTTRGLKYLWQGLVAIDLLVRASCAVRPYEIRKGSADEAHRANLVDIEAGLAAGDIGPALKRSADRLRSIGRRRERRPVVGIAGDIYTRANPVANHGLFPKLEELGCEVRPSPFFVDEVDFDFSKGLRQKLVGRAFGASSILSILYLRKELEKVRVRRRLNGAVPQIKEPTYGEIVKFTQPYVGLDGNEFLFLNIAKMANFARQGADGVINAICFNCMLGTVSTAIATKVRRDYGQIPIPTFIYTGSELAAEKTRLEAFVYQVRQFANRRERRSGSDPNRDAPPD